MLGMWLVALPAIASGAMNVLGPLRLGELGADAAGIGATFLIAAAIEAVMSPVVGHLSDRRGPIVPLRVGLAAAAVALLFFTLPDNALLLAVVIVLETVALGTFWAPAMAMLSDAADLHGMSQSYALALVNFAWAAGQIAGAGGGGALAKAAGDAVPFALSAALCAATLALILVRGRTPGRARAGPGDLEGRAALIDRVRDVRLEPLDERWADDVAALIEDSEVLRFTRIPEPPPAGFVRGWLRSYEAGRRDGTREGFAAIDGAGRFLGLALAPQHRPRGGRDRTRLHRRPRGSRTRSGDGDSAPADAMGVRRHPGAARLPDHRRRQPRLAPRGRARRLPPRRRHALDPRQAGPPRRRTTLVPPSHRPVDMK